MSVQSPWLLLALGTAIVALIMLALWLLGVRNRNFSYVDVGWSANFAVLAALYGSCATGWGPRRALIAAIFAIHGLRLAWHLSKRIVGRPEEGRYVQLRKEWSQSLGNSGNLNLKFLAFFEFQAALNVFLSLPLLLACFNPAPAWHGLEWLGTAICLAGLIGESTADAQLAAFKRNPDRKGDVCDVGLWRYSRHPNYFFEWLIWVGYAIFALASPLGWLALAMPVVMLHFLVNVTGIAATEAQALRSKGEPYRRYQASTSTFIPWFPKKDPGR